MSLTQRANEFNKKCAHSDLFEWCVGAMDGLTIQIAALRSSEAMDQSRFFLVAKKSLFKYARGL
jgi:hypothetical protein